MRTDLPLDIRISFHKIIEAYREQATQEPQEMIRRSLEKRLEYVEQYQELSHGLKDPAELMDFVEPIHILLKDLFPSILSDTEIKAVSLPFHNLIFNPTRRLKNILEEAGPDFDLQIRQPDPEHDYVSACILILNSYYGYNIKHARTLHYDIPDREGMPRQYSASQYSQFFSIEPTELSRGISDQDVDLLIQHMDRLDLWKQYFPPQSWIFKGFSVMHLNDVTQGEAISKLKWTLLNKGGSYTDDLERLEEIFRSIYRISDLQMGFSFYNREEQRFKRLDSGKSFLLQKEAEAPARDILHEEGYRKLMEQRENYIITNVDAYLEKQGGRPKELVKNMERTKSGSAIFAPVARDHRLFGVLELVSERKNELNSINATRLDEIMPYIVTAVERSVSEFENRVKAVIQSECTSIHPSVLWVFEKEARRFMENQDADGMASFHDIVFEDVHPLYGQIDIVASSQARNQAIQEDLLQQLRELKDLIQEAKEAENLELYEQITFRLTEFIEELETDLNASSEQQVFNLLDREIQPVLEHLESVNPPLRSRLREYRKMVNQDTGLVYDRRQDYDASVQQVNQSMARYLDRKQREAQEIFPHYFERYKTDGVDHNIYIGASLSNNKEKPFDEVYLYGIRLWQLKTMCEMENRFYQLQENLPMKLEAASLILVFSNTLSIRYRMDEKRFDVDGTYNARYEIIKKRIDKACVKDTEERVAQKGKIAVVYSLRKDEREYLRYIKYLQCKGYLGEQVELLELEDVQGVVGLKAIRVEVLYRLGDDDKQEGITYQDLLDKEY